MHPPISNFLRWPTRGADHNKSDEIENLHVLKEHMLKIVDGQGMMPGKRAEAATAFAMLSRLQAELEGKLNPRM
jgi:hypothetical protein